MNVLHQCSIFLGVHNKHTVFYIISEFKLPSMVRNLAQFYHYLLVNIYKKNIFYQNIKPQNLSRSVTVEHSVIKKTVKDIHCFFQVF